MTHTVRGVAVLDRNDRLCLLDTLACTANLRSLVEKVLYASVDVLDEKISGAGAIRTSAENITDRNAASMTGMVSATHPTGTAPTLTDDAVPGLYLGQLATQGQLSVYGFVTSVQKRILLCVDWQSDEKINDLVVRDMLRELTRMYVEESVANPFSTAENQDGGPTSFRDTARLRKICDFHPVA